MEKSRSLSPESDDLAKRLFVFAIAGVVAYVVAVIALMSVGN